MSVRGDEPPVPARKSPVRTVRVKTVAKGVRPRSEPVGYKARQKPATRRVVRRMNPREVRRRLLWLFGAVVAGTFAGALLTSPWLYIRTVRVEGLSGLEPLEAAAVLTQCDVPPRTNLIRAPARALAHAIERVPAVAEARIGRRPPGTLVISIVPRRPECVLVAGEQQWEVDNAGTPIRSAPAGLALPRVEVDGPVDVRPGKRIADGIASAGIAALRWSKRVKTPPVDKIEVDHGGDVCLNMRDGVVLRLGQGEQLDAKFRLAQRIYDEAPNIASEVEAIDLRCPEAPACTPRGSGAEKPEQKKTDDEHSTEQKPRRERR